MDDLEYIKNFSKIKMYKLCEKSGVFMSNIYTGSVSEEKLKKLRKCIENEIAKLYIMEEKKDVDS